MAFSFTGFLKGILLQNEVDRSKQLAIQISSSATTDTATTIVSAQTADRTLNLPDISDTLSTPTLTETLTNKTINAPDNTITNIANTNIASGAAIAVNKLAAQTANRALMTDGSGFLAPSVVTSTELGYVSGVTSSIQDQLNSAAVDPMTTLGDMIYENATPAPARLPGNITSVKQFLSQTGTGSVSAVPAWTALSSGDIPNNSANTSGTASNVSGTVAIGHGGTGQVTASAAFDALSPMTTGGDVIYGGTSGTGTRLANGSNGQMLTSNGGTTAPSWTTPAKRNFLVNGAFDIWQRSITKTATNNNWSMTADRWGFTNDMGASGVVTGSRVTGTLDGSLYGLSIKVTTPPTVGSAFAPKLFYAGLETRDMIQLYNKTVSFSINVKALGNVNQVQIDIMYQTAEDGVAPNVGRTSIASTTVAVNTSTFTLCKLENVAIGTAMTTSGAIAVQVKASTVSSGNLSDNNNGFVVEQAMLNLGATVGTFKRCYETFSEEHFACQRYFEKSPLLTIFVPDSSSSWGGAMQYNSASTNPIFTHVNYKTRKRVAPSLTRTWNPQNGTLDQASDRSGGSNQTLVTHDVSENSMIISQATVVSNHQYAFHWIADAEMVTNSDNSEP